MINHVRTLLMNETADPGFQEPGEEFIDPTFLPRTVPSSRLRYRSVLFGATPDRVMLNYRMRQLLPLLHETDLVEFVMEDDERLTYSFESNPFFDPTIYNPRIVQTAGSNVQLQLLGPPMISDSSGSMKQTWIVTIRSGNTVDVSQQQVNPVVVNNYPYTITSGLSSHVPVPGSSENFFIFEEPSVGDQWFVTLYSRPQASLGTLLLAARAVEEPSRLDLFQRDMAAGHSEPLQTFYNMFVEHPDTAYALGGLLLAIIR